MIIGLFGLSGSGKSHLSKDFKSANPDFYCTSASKLLSSIDRPIIVDKLNEFVLDKNQEILPNLLNSLNKKNKKILIELHAIIEKQDSTIYKVDEQILLALALDYIFLLETPEELVLKQRLNDKSKNRKIISLENLIKINRLQKDYLLKIYGNKLICIKNHLDINNIISSI